MERATRHLSLKDRAHEKTFQRQMPGSTLHSGTSLLFRGGLRHVFRRGSQHVRYWRAGLEQRALIQFGVDQKAEPECLQNVVDESSPAVEKSQPHNIAVEEKQETARKQRNTQEPLAQCPFGLHRSPAAPFPF